MQLIAKKLWWVTVLFIFLSCFLKLDGSRAAEINIIPRPVSVRTLAGHFVLDAATQVVVSSDAELNLIAAKLIQKINAASRFRLNCVTTLAPANKAIILKLNSSREDLGVEGYELRVSPRQIEIQAVRPAGVFYGVQSLLQLLPVELEDTTLRWDAWQIPGVEIIDYPRFQWRGQLLDVSRHFHTLDHLKRKIDNLARLKMNKFHLHLTDDQGWRLEIKSLPKLTEIGAWRVDHNNKLWWERPFPKPGEKATYGGFYTQEEMQALIQYARERNVEIIPEIDLPGHARAFMAAYPEVSCDGAHYDVASGGDERNKDVCPAKEVTYQYAEKIFAEVAALFPSKYIHIGGDEARMHGWKKCPDCKQKMQAEGLKNFHELQSYFMQRLEKIINQNGKAMIGWDEILEGGLAPNATVMSWRGEIGGIESVKMGHDVIMTPNTYCYLDLKQGDPELEPPELGYSQLLLPTVYSYNPIPTGFTDEQAKRILGVQGNLWSESLVLEEQANYMLYPRLFAVAEVGWSPQELRNWPDFVRRMEVMLQRFDLLGINYALSAYNVWINPDYDQNQKKIAFKLETEAGTVAIRYTLDGTEPDSSSKLYDQPIVLDATATIKARSFKDGKPYGTGITTKKIVVHQAAGKPVMLTFPPHERYHHGELTLTDCFRGRPDQVGKNWLGFENNFEAILDLEKMTQIDSVTFSFLESTFDRAFPPSRMEISYSANGEEYVLLKTIETKPAERDVKATRTFSVMVAKKVSYIKIAAENIGLVPTWQYFEPGKKAWIFIDEIIVAAR
ncbi:family 20 glycosylhydrolase [candidate division KSB1 bacterium]|nr:family 20 glycosylhydrolase [candidate division KSB1 bacterium]